MSAEDLKAGIEELRRALDAADAGLSTDEASKEGVRDLSLAVNSLRGGVWEFLKATAAGDFQSLLSRMRVRRAIESCEDVLSEIYAETLSKNAPGLELFRVTLRELSEVGRSAQQ
ncbi:MAG: hypothetical protein OER90_11210 [Gemmatimonadota bacterium]|jgi:hypothetical protein|nr:hypothetical protein [Gemmatimonadota bacterium]